VVLLTTILAVMLTKGNIMIRQFLNGYAIPFAMFVCAKNSFHTHKEVQRFLLWFAVPLSLYFPINQMFEYYRLTQFVFPRYILSPVISGQYIHWGERAMGAFLHPVVTGSAMVSVYVLSMYRLSSIGGALPKLMKAVITLLTPVAVFFTHTRSVYLGYFAAMMVLLAASRRQRMAGLFVLVVVALAILGNWSSVATGERTAGGLATKSTAQARLVLAKVSLEMFRDRPFVGVGFTRFQEYSVPYVRTVRSTVLGYRESWIGKHVNQHNQLLTVLTEIGLIGFIPLVLIYIWLLKLFVKARHVKTDNYDADLVVAVGAVWTVYMINIQFIEPRFFEFMNAFPYILAGIIVGGYQRAMMKKQTKPVQDERSS
jgi:O-antigen ligase